MVPFIHPKNTAPPKIAPFDFGEEATNSGDAASVVCRVTTGDLPLNFKWLFNGRPANEFAGITSLLALSNWATIVQC